MSRQIRNGETRPASTETLDLEGVSPAQHAAILALLESPTLSEAARVSKVSFQTIGNWLKEPAFQKALRNARHLAVRQASLCVQVASGLAAKTLLEVMQSENATAASRLSAARTTLEYSYHLIEADDIAERLAVLERVKTRGGGSRQPER